MTPAMAVRKKEQMGLKKHIS